MECQFLAKQDKFAKYEEFYSELSELVTKETREVLYFYKSHIDEEITKLGLSLIEKINLAPPPKQYEIQLGRIESTGRLNACIAARILDLFQITLVFKRCQDPRSNVSKLFMPYLFPDRYDFPDNFAQYVMKITWLDDNPFLYDLRPKKSPVISTPKEFSSIRNSEYLGLELWNQALIGSGTDVIFHIRDKKFHAHLCVLNIHSENSVFKKMFDQSKYSKWVPPGIELSFTPEMKIFEVLFKFLYTGRIDSDLHLEQWIELHMLAYVYAISSLKEMTLHLIKQCIKDVKDEKNFKTLLEVTYKYKSIETKIPLILLKHLNKEEDSNLIKKVKDNQMLKSFQRIAIDKTLTNAVFHLTAKILSNLDAL